MRSPEVDVLFIPDKPVPTDSEILGLLGKLAQSTCLFEVYRNAVQPKQVRKCLSKLSEDLISWLENYS